MAVLPFFVSDSRDTDRKCREGARERHDSDYKLTIRSPAGIEHTDTLNFLLPTVFLFLVSIWDEHVLSFDTTVPLMLDESNRTYNVASSVITT